MFGRLLCWIGWHEFRYMPYPEFTDGRRCNREQAAHMVKLGYAYECARCGEQP